MATRFTRRQILQSGLALGAGFGLSLPRLARLQEATAESTAEGELPMHFEVTGNIAAVHDPVVIKAEDTYYLFCTGSGIPIRKSANLVEWRSTLSPIVFARTPAWASERVPANTPNDFWAPDIAFYNDKYHLYYSISSFGSNRSAIGLVTNQTLDVGDDNYQWVDEGLVIASTEANNYNCIDPNFVLDADGVPWLAFGSFWSGIKMRRLDPETSKLSEEDTTLYSLSQRFVNSGSVEAPFIIRRGDLYYLFVSFDFCCRGVDSTYHVMVGRSETITGPYMDRDGVAMLEGGGTQVTFPTERWRGPGHNSILQENGVDYIVYHSYDAENVGTPTLRIDPLVWDDEGWPSIVMLD